MKVSVTEAKGQLAEPVRPVEAGDEVILTRRALLEKTRSMRALRATPGPGAARSQDFLYGGDGLPK